MINFETAIKEAAQRAVLKIVEEGKWVEPDYNNRFKLPKEFMHDIWLLVDKDKLKQAIVNRLHDELADRIMNHIAAELSTDIKSILSIPERREAIRALARNNIDQICKTQ